MDHRDGDAAPDRRGAVGVTLSWSALCARRAAELAGGAAGGPEPGVFAAFGGGDETRAAGVSALLKPTEGVAARLPGRIKETLSREVDTDQAALFARRFSDVGAILQRLGTPGAGLLWIGLVQRTAEVLAGPAPRALRVRAVADFYSSHAAILHHGRRGPPLSDLVQRLSWRSVAPGMQHATLSGPSAIGPVNVNALRLRGGRIVALDSRGEGALPEVAVRRGAAAAISGGFFLYSEADISLPSRRTDPVGLLVSGGVVHNPPALRRSALTQRRDGRIVVETIGLQGWSLRWNDGTRARISTVNRPASLNRPAGVRRTGDVSAYNRAWGPRSPDAMFAIALVGRRVVARGRGPLQIPLAGVVITLAAPPPDGDPIWQMPAPLEEAMAGGPRLLRDGAVAIDRAVEDFAGSAPPITFSRDETFDQNLLPRMAAGLTADRALVLVAVDGRNFHRAPGMTLRQTAELARLLGCTDAMNLDGGSSKRMVVQGRVVDLTSTEVVAGTGGPARVRPVNSAILLFGSSRLIHECLRNPSSPS